MKKEIMNSSSLPTLRKWYVLVVHSSYHAQESFGRASMNMDHVALSPSVERNFLFSSLLFLGCGIVSWSKGAVDSHL